MAACSACNAEVPGSSPGFGPMAVLASSTHHPPIPRRFATAADTLATIITAVATAIPELMKVVNLILLPTGGVANNPVALMIWVFLILTLVSAVWAFVQGMMRRNASKKA